MRPGEKTHEELISIHDSPNVYDLKKYFVIANPSDEKIINNYKKKGKLVKKDFFYSSNNNSEFLSVNELKSLISKEFFKKKLNNS